MLVHLELYAVVPSDDLQYTVRDLVPVEPQVDAEQAPHDESCQAYVSHAGVVHDVEVESFLPASHSESAAAAPLDVLQSTERDLVPVEPQVDVEQAPHDE